MHGVVMAYAFRGRAHHGVVAAQRMVKHANFVLGTDSCRWTQHCGRHRTPDGQQYGKQDQQPESKVLHGIDVSQVIRGAGATDKFRPALQERVYPARFALPERSPLIAERLLLAEIGPLSSASDSMMGQSGRSSP